VIEVDKEKCTGCQKCIKVCPYDAITLVDKKAVVGDECTLCGACEQNCSEDAITIQRKKVEIDVSKYNDVWVVAEVAEDKIKNVTLELLGKGRELADELKQGLCAVLLGKDIKKFAKLLSEQGADKIYLAENDLLEYYNTDAYNMIISGLILQYNPNIILFGATHVGRDLAPRIASNLELGLTADCTGLSIYEGQLLQTRPAFGGNVMADILSRTRPQMATVRPNVMKKLDTLNDKDADIVDVPLKVDPRSMRTKVIERTETCGTGVCKIDESDVVIAGGRGVGSKDGVDLLQQLADELGGVVGATRVIVDEQWLPKSVQIGQSGITISPKLYIGCGISGAIQHLVGMKGAEIIIVVNKDPNAPIFEVAQYGIVGDLHEVVPELIKAIKDHKANQ
jgi:electron transfer flavoprotein alpha subunit